MDYHFDSETAMDYRQASSAGRRGIALRYGVALGISALALLLTWALLPILGQGLFMLLYAALLLCAWYGGIGPTLAATMLMAAVTAYLFLGPPYSFAVGPAVAFQLLIFAALGALAGALAEGRRKAELAAEARSERMRVTLTSIGDAVIVTDSRGTITLMNPVAESLTGWTEAEALGRPSTDVFRIVHANTRQSVESPVLRVLREGVKVGLANHTLLIAKDGTMRPIDDSGAPIRDVHGTLTGVVLVFRDVTGRQEAEAERTKLFAQAVEAQAAAEATQQRLTFLTSALTTFTASLDYTTTVRRVVELVGSQLADWCTVFISDTEEEQRWFSYAAGSPEKQAILEEIHARYPPDKNPRSIVSRVLQSGESVLIPEMTEEIYQPTVADPEHLALIRALGITSYMAMPLRLHGRTIGLMVLGMTGTGRRFSQDDVSLAEELARRAAVAVENTRLYAAERRARAEAEAAVHVRDQFLSIAAHELRTPLTSLQGNAELLQRRARREGGFEPRNQRAIQTILDQANRLSRMISSLLDVTRIETGQLVIERAPLDICALLRRIVEEGEQARDGRVIELDCPEQLLVVGDALRLEQVFQNLIQNALKYSEPPAPVTVSVSQSDGMALVKVTDRGIGIPQQDLSNLFQRFFRARNVEEQRMSGMGIGLYVVHEVVELHGGSVSVESTEHVGSTFTVSLPLSEPQAPAPADPS